MVESDWLDAMQQNAIIVTMQFLAALLEAFLLLIPQSYSLDKPICIVWFVLHIC